MGKGGGLATPLPGTRMRDDLGVAQNMGQKIVSHKIWGSSATLTHSFAIKRGLALGEGMQGSMGLCCLCKKN